MSHVGNIWIGPWANFPHYMDPTLTNIVPYTMELQKILSHLLEKDQAHFKIADAL